jgi:hypothetical protein
VLYFTPVFQTLLVFPSFLVLMIISPIAMSVFGPQIAYPSLLAAFFALLFFFILGIKQVIFVSRTQIHHALHLALVYCASLLFFAAPGTDWYVIRSLAFAFMLYLLVREFLIIRNAQRGQAVKLMSATISFMLIEAVWVVSLLPIGFINAAGILLVCAFTLEELVTRSMQQTLTRSALATELATLVALLLTIFIFSSWTLP